MKIATHAFRSLAALLVLLALIPASVAKLGESERNVVLEEHDDKLDRQLMITTSDHHHEDDDITLTFSMTMEITDDTEHLDRLLLKILPIEWEDNWFETFGYNVNFTFEFDDSSDRNLESDARIQRRRRRIRRLNLSTKCTSSQGMLCRKRREFGCPEINRRDSCPNRRSLVEGDDLVTTMQQFGDEMSNMFVSIDNVNVTV
eukprot:scaffold279392_cov67-Attheya_sp.AAC.3